jgi:hypothetical protein
MKLDICLCYVSGSAQTYFPFEQCFGSRSDPGSAFHLPP